MVTKHQRGEQEMFRVILENARADERVRAVYMNGSRANPNADRDIFQDYDIVYSVIDTAPFISDDKYPTRFGEVLYMQLPELELSDEQRRDNWGWLVQYNDGNRIDLHVEPVEKSVFSVGNDSLCVVLLDKDGVLPAIPPSSDRDYHVKKPDQAVFSACANEFWWCLNNVAKGLWRNELTYAMDMIDAVVRPQLLKLLSWKAGERFDYRISVGKCGKYLPRYIAADIWERYISTFSAMKRAEMWQAVLRMCALFSETAAEYAAERGFFYDEREQEAGLFFLHHVKDLPEDAESIF